MYGLIQFMPAALLLSRIVLLIIRNFFLYGRLFCRAFRTRESSFFVKKCIDFPTHMSENDFQTYMSERGARDE